MASSRKSRSVEPPAAVAAFLTHCTPPGWRICVGLSGGIDSVVLLHALAELRGRWPLALSACHVHHGLSPSASKWAEFCTAMCTRLEVPIAVSAVRPTREGRGLEAAARSLRLAALAQMPADAVALAHHRDDQAETLLLRLLRGTGVRGAGAMRPIEGRQEGPPLIRPLLAIGRAEIAAWARRRGLSWIEDESNADTAFDRNFVRHRLIPQAAERFSSAAERLAGATAHFREAQHLLDQLATLDWERSNRDGCLPRAAFAATDPGRRRNLLRWRIHALGLLAPDERRLVEAMRQLDAVDDHHPLYLPLGSAALCHYRGRVWVQAQIGDVPDDRVWRGESTVPWAGGELCFEDCTGDGVAASALRGEVVVGRRQEGETLRPVAGGPARSIKNLAQEAGVPPWLRPQLPMLRSRGRLIWAAGLGVAADAVCPPGEPGVRLDWRLSAGALSRLPPMT